MKQLYIDYHNQDDTLVYGTTTTDYNGSYALHTAESAQDKKLAKNKRDLLLVKTGFSDLITLDQTHSETIHIIDNGNKKDFIENSLIQGDGLLAELKGVLMGISTADCIPIFYFSIDREFIGIVHAGRVGMDKKIHLKMLSLIQERFPEVLQNLRVIIGAHIKECCYEIGPELAKSYSSEWIILRNGRFYLNMEKIVRTDLYQRGLPEKSITSSDYCTKCSASPGFYSYRNGNKSERNLSFIGIKG